MRRRLIAFLMMLVMIIPACAIVSGEETEYTVTLPKTATDMYDYQGNVNIAEATDIFVEEGNETFRSIDGVLFTRDGKTMLMYPRGRTEDRYVVPEGTERIESSFEFFEESYEDDEGNQYYYEEGCRIKTLVLPASFRSFELEDHCLYFSKIERFEVDPENPFFCAIDGVLFSKDRKVLAAYPQGRPDKSYTVPDGVLEIGPYAFYTNRNLTSVFLPDSVQVIDDHAFEQCRLLKTVRLPDHMDRIGFGAFCACYELSGIKIPDGLTEMEGEMLWGTAQQGALHIPEGITQIGQDALRFQYTVTDIYWPDSLECLVDDIDDGAVKKGSDAHLYMVFGWNDVRLVDFAVVMHAHEGTPAAEWVKPYPHVIAPRGVDTMDADGYAELCTRLMREAGYPDAVICYNPEMELMAVKPLVAYNLHKAVAVFQDQGKLLLCGFDDSDGEWGLRWVNENFLDDGNLPVGMSFYGEEMLEIILPDAGEPLEKNAFAYYFDARTFMLGTVHYYTDYMFYEYKELWKCGVQDNTIIYVAPDKWALNVEDGEVWWSLAEPGAVFTSRPLEPGIDNLMTASRMPYPPEEPETNNE